jgi:ubiquinone/menaquinone biosynthesis C-methylase UbiE
MNITQVEQIIEQGTPNDYYAVKRLDRQLSRSFIGPNHTVCDIGGGAGIDAIPFAALAKHCTLLDVNTSRLKSGKKLANTIKLNNKMSFVRGSATHLPFKEDLFDLSTSFSVLDHVPGKNSHITAIKEMSRVTHNLGYVVVTLPNTYFLLGNITRKIIQLMGNPHLEIHFTPKEIKHNLKSAHLKPIIFDAVYPTELSNHVLSFHLPTFLTKLHNLLPPLVTFWENLFKTLEKTPLKLFGPRMGYTAQKTIKMH